MSPVSSILVVRAGALGDTLMVTPVLRALAERYPEAAVDLLCSSTAAPILETDPRVRSVLPLRLRKLPFCISWEKRKLVREISRRGYDLAILLERAPAYRRLLERAAIRTVRSFHETPFDPAAHAIANNLRAAGCGELEPPPDMEIFLSPAEEETASALLSGLSRPLIGIHVGYGPRRRKRKQSQRLKGWPRESFSVLGRALAERGAHLVFTGSREDAADIQVITEELPRDRYVDLSGRTTVRELAAVIAKLDLFVSVDSGPAHMAAALGTPLVVLWGPAILEQTRPVSSSSEVTIVRHPVPCAPCYETPLMKSCRRNVCMESIRPEEVLAEVRARFEV